MTNVNQLDDDLNNRASASLNQRQNVIAAGSKVPTTLSNINSGSGTVPNPGPAGFGGSQRPGRRIYNPLSKLASYTYNFTLYMITPDAYEAFINSGRKKIDAFAAPANGTGIPNTSGITGGAYIIAQTGGINNSSSKRAPGFELDIYMDNVKFTTQTNTKTTGTSTGAVSDFEFTITEPYGFSFVTNLRKAGLALQQYSQSAGYKNLSNQYKQFYIIGLRFYGYDKDGNVVKPNSDLFGEPIDPVGTDALFENFYDVQLSELKFKLDGKTVVYNIKCTGTSGQTLLGVKRGRMPTGANVSGTTVADALTGGFGLFSLLQNNQEQLVNKKDPQSQSIANTYEVVWLGDAETEIGGASLVTDASLDKWRWGGSGAKNTTDANDLSGQQPPDDTRRLFTFNNDTSIIQAIDTIIKSSQYMVKALATTYANVKEPDYKNKNNPQVKQDNPATIKWYTVSAEIAKAQWDSTLQDWAYHTKYIIQTYDIPSIETPYAKNQQRYYGPHKRYDYWFTGKNTEVLDFNMQFDVLYFNAVLGIENKPDYSSANQSENPGSQREGQENTAGGGSGSSAGNTTTTSNNSGLKADPKPETANNTAAGSASGGGQVSVSPGLRSGGDKTGGLGPTMEAQNSVLTYLNDAGAYANGTIRILGDPDFLVRDASSSVQSLYDKFYGADGFTVSAQGGQVFIEVAFKEAVDYNTKTGLMEINENIFFVNYPPYIKDIAKGAIVWAVASVQSTFASGRFEQVLQLIGPTFDGIGPAIGPAATDPEYITNPNVAGTSADDDASKPKSQLEKQISAANNSIPPPLPPPKMSSTSPTLQSSTQSILQNKDNFGRPVTVNTFGQ